MRSFVPVYATLAVASVISLGIAGIGSWIVTQPARIEIAGIPSTVNAKVGDIDERYVDATARHFIGLLMHWNDTNRALRFSTAGQMMDPALIPKFSQWVKRYYPALEWFDKTQSFRFEDTKVVTVSPGRWEVAARGRATSSFTGLGEEEREVEIRLVLTQTEANEVNPYLVQVAGIKIPDHP